jgi:ubiquinone/menaquinone biosynthesis C-methylase UbiE
MLARRTLLAAPLAAAQTQVGPVAVQKRNASNAQAALYASIAAFWEPHDREMLQWLGMTRGTRVLDLGCGRGDHLVLFAEMLKDAHAVTGFDLRQDSLDFAAARLKERGWSERAVLRQGDLYRLPFAAGSFDLVWSSHVFHGLPDLPKAAAAVHRVLSPGGRFALRENRVTATLLPPDIGVGETGLETRLNGAFDRWLQRDRATRGRYPHGWLHLLRQAGFSQVTARSFLHQVTPPFNAAQREYLHYWLERKQEIEGIEPADRDLVRRITDRDSEQYFLRRDDLHYVSVSTIYSGTKT